MWRATTSLPAPLSPRMRTVRSESASWCANLSIACMVGDAMMKGYSFSLSAPPLAPLLHVRLEQSLDSGVHRPLQIGIRKRTDEMVCCAELDRSHDGGRVRRRRHGDHGSRPRPPKGFCERGEVFRFVAANLEEK